MVEPIDIRGGLVDPDKILGSQVPAGTETQTQTENTGTQEPPAQIPGQAATQPPISAPGLPDHAGANQPAQPATQTQVEPSVEFKIDALNKWLESNQFEYRIETEDQLREVISSLNQVEELQKEADEYRSKQPYIEELEGEFQSLINERDPVNIFGSPEAYHAHLVAQQLARGRDVSNPRIQGLIQNLAHTDMSKLDDLDVVALGWQYDSPKFVGREVEIRKAILNDVGVDPDVLADPNFKVSEVELTPEQELKLSRLRKAEQDRFDAVKASIKVPDQKDWKSIIQEKVDKKNQNIQAAAARVEQLRNGWSAEAKRAAESMKSFDLVLPNEKGENVVEFSYGIDAEFAKLIPDMMIGYALQQGLEPTPENVKAVQQLVKGVYVMKNLEKIMVSHKNEVESKLREQQGREQHNGRPINTQGPPPDRSQLTEADLINIVAENVLKR